MIIRMTTTAAPPPAAIPIITPVLRPLSSPSFTDVGIGRGSLEEPGEVSELVLGSMEVVIGVVVDGVNIVVGVWRTLVVIVIIKELVGVTEDRSIVTSSVILNVMLILSVSIVVIDILSLIPVVLSMAVILIVSLIVIFGISNVFDILVMSTVVGVIMAVVLLCAVVK